MGGRSWANIFSTVSMAAKQPMATSMETMPRELPVSLDMGVAFAFAEVVFAAAVARSIAHLLERHLVEAAQLAAVQLLASLAQFFKRQNTNL
jgi:hypothetical protein